MLWSIKCGSLLVKMTLLESILHCFKSKWTSTSPRLHCICERSQKQTKHTWRTCAVKIYSITVCTVVQNCCNGRSKKYRKWHFWGCSLSETLQWIDIKFGRDDNVGYGSQYAKWHINRFRDVITVCTVVQNWPCRTVVTVVRKSIGNGTFGGAPSQKPFNGLT